MRLNLKIPTRDGFAVEIQSRYFIRKGDIITSPCAQQRTVTFRALFSARRREMQTRFKSVDTETFCLSSGVRRQVAVDYVQLFDVGVVDEPGCPHGVRVVLFLEVFVPSGRARTGNIWTKLGPLLVAMLAEPVLLKTKKNRGISAPIYCMIYCFYRKFVAPLKMSLIN
jgi:hypothetical protein